MFFQQLQQVLPCPKQPTDFFAIAFRWENQQLVRNSTTKNVSGRFKKALNAKRQDYPKYLTVLNGFQPMTFLLTGSRGTGKILHCTCPIHGVLSTGFTPD